MNRTSLDLSQSPGLHEKSAAMLSALRDSGTLIFSLGGALVRLDRVDGRLTPIPLTIDALRHEVSIVCRCFYLCEKTLTEREIHPPRDAVADALASGVWPMPELVGVVSHPVLGPKGLILKNGYDPSTRLYLDLPSNLKNLKIPESPSSADLEAARDALWNIFQDFPFDCEASATHALAYFLTLLVRPAIDGAVPCFLIIAPKAGTGKTLLMSASGIAVAGIDPEILTETQDAEEFRKTFTALCLRGAESIVIDNVNARLDSSSLAAILTARRFQSRLLGQSKMVDFSVRSVIAITANNPILTSELVRRCVPIRMVAACENPEEGRKFAIPELCDYVRKHRASLVTAGLTLAQGWVSRGQPAGPTLGSFEAWAKTLGGILAPVASDFLKNIPDLRASADTDGEAWREFVESWKRVYGEEIVRTGDLVSHALESGIIDEKGSASMTRSLGRALAKASGQVFGESMIDRARETRGSSRWRLRDI